MGQSLNYIRCSRAIRAIWPIHFKEVPMSAKQKLHQAKLAAWKVRFQEQADSGLTVRDWCEQNNLSIHTYNY